MEIAHEASNDRAVLGPGDLRIALFAGNYHGVKDGAALTLTRLVGYLERQGVKIVVLAPAVRHPALEPGGELWEVPSVPVPFRSEYRFARNLNASMIKRLADFRPNLFHLATPDLLGLSALHLARRWGIPAVGSFHTRYDTYLQYYHLPLLDRLLTWHLTKFYGQCAEFYVPSESVAEILRRQGIGKNLKIWSRGVDGTLFHPAKRDMAWRRALGIDDAEAVLSFVGRLVLEKGLATLVRVVNGLKAQGHKFQTIIVGDGPQRQHLEAQLPGAVFTGFLHGEDLARAYASSDIFFNPSLTETFGNVTLEAMASGVSVVCADATGSQTLVAPGTTGFLADPVSIPDYVAKIGQLIAQPERRRRFGKAGRARAETYDWQDLNAGLLNHYLGGVRAWAAAGAGADHAGAEPLVSIETAASRRLD